MKKETIKQAVAPYMAELTKMADRIYDLAEPGLEEVRSSGIRLIFRSAKTTSIPLVARLATEENIAANVISASTQKLSEEIYGSMLLGVPAAQFDRAWEFLSGIENLQVEEASVGVQ